MQQQVWYIHVSGETRGPLSLRDLDVLLRTNEINSRVLGWRNGMEEWKALNDIDQVKEEILQSSKEIIEISKKRQSMFDNPTNNPPKAEPNLNQKDTEQKGKDQKNQNEDQQDQIIENKDQNPLTILQSTVDTLLKKTFHQTQDGKWNVFDEEKQMWTVRDDQPTEQIQILKQKLVTKLKNTLFFQDKGQKNRRKTTDKDKQQEEKELTKEQLIKKEKNKKKTKRAAEKKKQKWYKSKINSFIYISGLPFDITDEELKEFVTRAGVLRVDLTTGQQKMKIYKDEDGCPKGDAAVSYAREQSLQIALQILNGAQIRSGFPVKIQRAQFNQKDKQYIPREATKKQTKVQKIIAKKKEQKMLTWDERVEQQGQGLKIVILKHIFSPTLLHDIDYIDSVKREIADQLGTIGEIQRIRFYQAHVEGVVQVKFKNDKDAEECIHVMNGRFYDGRQVICEYWDGETDYKRSGDLDLIRIQQFGKELEDKVQELQKIQQEKEEYNQDQKQDESQKDVIKVQSNSD